MRIYYSKQFCLANHLSFECFTALKGIIHSFSFDGNIIKIIPYLPSDTHKIWSTIRTYRRIISQGVQPWMVLVVNFFVFLLIIF